MRTLRLKFIVLFVCGIALRGISQSSSVLQIEAADKLYNAKDYANAVVFYNKLLTDSTIYKQRVLPYRVQLVNMMKRPAQAAQDSTKKDSLKTEIKQPVVTKTADTTKAKPLAPGQKPSQYDYVLYRLAQSYRLNADYNNAVMNFKKCVDQFIQWLRFSTYSCPISQC